MKGGKLIKKNNDETFNLNINNEANKGAKLLASGSSSCVFRPNIPCKDTTENQTLDKISKILTAMSSFFGAVLSV